MENNESKIMQIQLGTKFREHQIREVGSSRRDRYLNEPSRDQASSG